jgi:Family of unknown function (DUF6491)
VRIDISNIPGGGAVNALACQTSLKGPMMTMTRILSLGAALLALAVMAPVGSQAADAPKICLSSNNIRSTHAVDDSTILFTMNDGKVWKNTLRAPCSQLKFRDSFTYADFGGTVCANDQKIRVLESTSGAATLRNLGPFCQLGEFTPVTP